MINIILYAILRWENAVIIAGMALLIAFGPRFIPSIPLWVWVILGVGGVISITLVSMHDSQESDNAVNDILTETYDLSVIKDSEILSMVRNGITIKRKVLDLVAGLPTGSLKTSVNFATSRIDEWLSEIYDTAVHTDSLLSDSVLQNRMEEIKNSIRNLESIITSNTHIQESIKQLKIEQASLAKVQDKVEGSVAQISESLSKLNMIYTTIRDIELSQNDNYSAQSIEDDINQQIQKLQTISSSLANAYHKSE